MPLEACSGLLRKIRPCNKERPIALARVSIVRFFRGQQHYIPGVIRR